MNRFLDKYFSDIGVTGNNAPKFIRTIITLKYDDGRINEIRVDIPSSVEYNREKLAENNNEILNKFFSFVRDKKLNGIYRRHSEFPFLKRSGWGGTNVTICLFESESSLKEFNFSLYRTSKLVNFSIKNIL